MMIEEIRMEDFVAQLTMQFADFLKRFNTDLYYLMRSYRVKHINPLAVAMIAAFLSYYRAGFKVCTERMIRHLVSTVMKEKEYATLMTQLHRLGDFKVITVIRTVSEDQAERYRFILTEAFLAHVDSFWEKRE